MIAPPLSLNIADLMSAAFYPVNDGGSASQILRRCSILSSEGWLSKVAQMLSLSAMSSSDANANAAFSLAKRFVCHADFFVLKHWEHNLSLLWHCFLRTLMLQLEHCILNSPHKRLQPHLHSTSSPLDLDVRFLICSTSSSPFDLEVRLPLVPVGLFGNFLLFSSTCSI